MVFPFNFQGRCSVDAHKRTPPGGREESPDAAGICSCGQGDAHFPQHTQKSALPCAFKNNIGKEGSFIVYALATGIVQEWFECTTKSSGGAERKCLVLVATAVMGTDSLTESTLEVTSMLLSGANHRVWYY